MRQKKRIILVTGGNRGIGLAVVKGLAKDKNNTVLLGCRKLSQGKSQTKKLSDNVTTVVLDLSTKETLKKHIQRIKKKYPRIDVLVNNAGILIDKHFLNISPKKMEESLQVNLLAPLQLIQALVPQMIKNNYGRVVNISSGYGSFDSGLRGPFAYSLSKAGLNALTLIVSYKLQKNVKINSMCPGWVRTRMGGMNASRSTEQGAETALWLANLDSKGPNGGFF